MASLSKRRKENLDGHLFVDTSCINCGTCWNIAPKLFCKSNGKSAVYYQPNKSDDWMKAQQALLSCPVSAIGSAETRPIEVRAALESFPQLIEENVFYCGYTSTKSYGASSYFIQRKEGNVLVDSPRFNPNLVKQIELLGGIKYLFLSHKDDVADHNLFSKHFGCSRILHVYDLTADTQDVEMKISGETPKYFADDLLMIPTPGHTKGHMVLLHKSKFLFTGDHLAYSQANDSLYAFANSCWYSWKRQIESVQLLKNFHFNWILPAHGGRMRFDVPDMNNKLDQCLIAMNSYSK